jgi:hypothetical protein
LLGNNSQSRIVGRQKGLDALLLCPLCVPEKSQLVVRLFMFSMPDNFVSTLAGGGLDCGYSGGGGR